jgi:hypothetical protein
VQPQAPPAKTDAVDAAPATSTVSGDAIASLLREQIQKLAEDKQDLRDELKIKNKQIEQANERDRETHILMRDLHQLLRDMQQRLPAPPSPVRADIGAPESATNIASIVDAQIDPQATGAIRVSDADVGKREEGSRRSRTTAKRSSDKGSAKRPKPGERSGSHKWYETPTLDRLFGRR